MIEIGNYEFQRYQKHKQCMKVLAYTFFGIFICIFLQKKQIIPEFIAKIGIIFSGVLGTIFLLKLLIDMWYRNNLNYSKYDLGFLYEPRSAFQKPENESRWAINKRGFHKLINWGDWGEAPMDAISLEQKKAEKSFRNQGQEPPSNQNDLGNKAIISDQNLALLKQMSFDEQIKTLFSDQNCPAEAQKKGYCN